jgi:hypothetical protein
MNALAAIGLYAWRELVLRWRANPASPLARWVLTFALSAAAGILLLGFAAAEGARRAELRRLGLDTIVIQAQAGSPLQERSALPADTWAAPLEGSGELLFLQQLPEPAFTPWGEPMPVFVAPLPLVGRLRAGAAGVGDAVWMTRSLPPGRPARLTEHNLPLSAITAASSGSLEALGLDDFAVMPAAAADERDGQGRLDIVLFRPGPGLAAGDAVGAVRRLFAAEGETAPVIRDPTPYRAALDAFTRSQDRWRTGMALLLCLCIVLAFGSIGMLEEKQTRFTQALLRSFGVSGAALWSMSLVENLVLANTALLAALEAGWMAARILLPLAGSPLAAPSAQDGAALLWLACAVNAGVVLSLAPLASALRRPVGVVLS